MQASIIATHAQDRVTGMHKNNWTKASIALAAPLLARTYEKSAGAAPAGDDGGVDMEDVVVSMVVQSYGVKYGLL